MTVYNNLKSLNFQVVETGTTQDGRIVYRYYFEDKNTGEIGIPLPDLNSKIRENYSEKYLETLIEQVFEENAPNYLMVESFYMQSVMTKKEEKILTKALQSEYAKSVNSIIKNTNEQEVHLFIKDNDLFAIFNDPLFNKQNRGGKFTENVRFNEYSFLSSIQSFKPYNDNIFFCEDATMTIEEAYTGFANLGFKTLIVK